MKSNKVKILIFFILILLLITLFLGCAQKYYRIVITKVHETPAREPIGDSKIKMHDWSSTTIEEYDNVTKIIDINVSSIRFLNEDGEEIFISDKDITKIDVFSFSK